MSLIKSSAIIPLLLIGITTNAQKQRVTIEKSGGDKIEVTADLITYKGKVAFPDDGKEFIKAKIGEEKIKIDKSEVSKIILSDGQEYQVLRDREGGSNFYVGYFITQNSFKVFKTYLHGHRTYGLSTTSSINKVTTEEYFVFENNEFKELNIKKDIEKLAVECDSFKNYVSANKVSKKTVEAALKYYDANCAK